MVVAHGLKTYIFLLKKPISFYTKNLYIFTIKTYTFFKENLYIF